MNAIHKIVMSFALFCAVSAAVAEARTVSIVASENPGSVKLEFGDPENQDTLYLHVGYGLIDGGDTPGGWANFVYVADITPDMTEYDCILPKGWGTSVTHVRYFLTTEHVDYAFSYDHITFKGNNSNGSYFVTDYTPIPSKTHVVTDFKLGASQNMALFCSRGASSKPTFTQFYIKDVASFRFDCGPETAAKYQAAVPVSVGTEYLVESGPGLKVTSPDGTEVGTDSKSDTNFNAPTVLYLFASQNNNTGFGNCANGEARFVRIYESDTGVYDKSTLVHEYVPVLNPNTGKGALYDMVDHNFIEPRYNGTTAYECEFVGPQDYEYVTAGSSESFAFVPRTIEVVSVTSAGGTTKATLAVSAGNLVREAVVLAMGDYDYGDELSAWPKTEVVSVVSPAAQQIEVEMPSDWNTADYSSARFFFVHCEPLKLDVYESVKPDTSSLGAYIDLGRKGVLGDMVQITVSGSGRGALFGVRESATTNCFSVKVNNTDIFIDYSDYQLSRGNYTSVSGQGWITILNSPTERRVYAGTDTSGAVVSGGSSWGEYQHYADPVTKDFTTPENLRLFDSYNDSDFGRFNGSVKSFYLWHIDGTETNLVMDLIPVRRSDKATEVGFYDRVSKRMFTNAADSGKFIVEGSVQGTVIDPTSGFVESEAQTVSAPVFASKVRARVVGDTVKIGVTVPDGQSWHVYAVYGDTDKGPDPAAWGTNVVIIADGSGTGSQEVVWTPPAGWRRKMKAVRFFLSSAAPMATYEYLKGDGKAYLDLGRKGVFGDMVSFKCRFNVVAGNGFRIFGARQSDATENNFSIQGGGNMYLDYSDYNDSRATCAINSADTATWLSFVSSPTLRQCWQNGASKGMNDNVVTKPFETVDNLRLFDVGGWSTNGGILNGCIKDFVLQHAEGSVTNDVMRLVPVKTKDNVCGMYDEVSGKLLVNAAPAGGNQGSFSVDEGTETGERAFPANKCTGVSDPVNRGGLPSRPEVTASFQR